jgi:hypothetical protein
MGQARHERTARVRHAPASLAAYVPIVSGMAGPEGPLHPRAPSPLAAAPLSDHPAFLAYTREDGGVARGPPCPNRAAFCNAPPPSRAQLAQPETHPAGLPRRAARAALCAAATRRAARAVPRAAPSDWPRRASRACGRLSVREVRARRQGAARGGEALLGNSRLGKGSPLGEDSLGADQGRVRHWAWPVSRIRVVRGR